MSSTGDRSSNPYVVSNDVWTGELVGELRSALAAQRIPEERATGVVIGTGGLPYIAGDLSASRLVLLDRSKEVIASTWERLGHMATESVTDWEEYMGLASQSQYLTHGDQIRLQQEFDVAQKTGLAGDFLHTQEQVRKLDVFYAQGDIMHTFPQVGAWLRGEGRIVSFLNLTNVAQYLPVSEVSKPQEAQKRARELLATLVGHLPLTDTTVILDSSFNHMRPRIRSPWNFLM